MPALDELRTALRDAERFAGDPEATLRTLERRHESSCSPDAHGTSIGRSTSRRSVLAWGLSAAAVLMFGVTTAAVVDTSRSSPHSNRQADAGPTSGVTKPPSRTLQRSIPSAAPADAIRWPFEITPTPGYTLTYLGYEAGENARADLTVSSDPGLQALITVHSAGTFDPSRATAGGAPARGQAVTINGRPGTYVGGKVAPTLFWTYAKNSWASVDVGGTRSAVKFSHALRVARMIHIPSSQPVTMPFGVKDIPPGVKFLSTSTPYQDDGTTGEATMFFGTSSETAHGVYFTVSRVSRSRASPSSQDPEGRTVTRTLPDGSLLQASVDPSHFRDISQTRLRAIANGIDVSPTLADRSTWLPVSP